MSIGISSTVLGMSDRDVAIGQNLARLRGDKTQQDIAEAMRAAGYKWSQATVWSVEKGERPLRLVEAEALSGVLKSSIDRMLLPDQDAELVDRLWRFTHDFALKAQDLSLATREFEDSRGALQFVVEDVSKRLDEADISAPMKPKIILKLSEARSRLQDEAETIVRHTINKYRADLDGEHDGIDPEA